jgi:hypothetical protein
MANNKKPFVVSLSNRNGGGYRIALRSFTLFRRTVLILSFWMSQGVTEESGGVGRDRYKINMATGVNVVIPPLRTLRLDIFGTSAWQIRRRPSVFPTDRTKF